MEHLKEPLRYLYLPAELNHCTPERRYSILTHSTRLGYSRVCFGTDFDFGRFAQGFLNLGFKVSSLGLRF